MPNLIGKSLGKVRVDMFLAKGGMAEVYIGTHTTLHRSVAIKFLKADLQGEPELRERFEREARTIAMLRHPNIVQVFDFDSYEDQPFLVMEYIPGMSLGSYLRELHKRNERLDLTQIQYLLTRIANALTYAHQNNVVHRDVKPANIMLLSRSTPVTADKPLPQDVEPILTDFGLVRFTQSNSQTSTGTITGTPAYMSPEQARGDKVDARTDVYSLGITVYEMLAGRVPFDADSTLSVLHKHIHEPPPPIDGLSKPIQDVIDRALAKEANERFQTPLEFAEAFEAVLSGTAEAETIGFPASMAKSIVTSHNSLQTTVKENKSSIVTPILVGIIVILIVVVASWAAQTLGKQAPITPPTSIATEIQSHNEATPAPSTTEAVPATPGTDPVGLLRFQDGSAVADQITFSSGELTLPAEGSQYELWLIGDDGESRLSLGVIGFDSSNRALLTYVDEAGRNLITFYHGLEITIEPNPDNSPNPSNDVAFSATLPPSGYVHVRHLLSAFPAAPNQNALIRGLVTDTTLVKNIGQEMLTSIEAGKEAEARLQAEKMLNIIVGSESEDHTDWNSDDIVDDPSDGFGLLLNGNNAGYIQGSFTHANLSITSPDANENMLVHGDHVKAAADNVGVWAPQLRDLLIEILESEAGSPETAGKIREAVVLANQMLNGVDINGNENIEPIPGEGGALTAYDHSYYMADIVIFP
ncbi:MAG: protein kinase [Anaerolineales bacterium]|nr:protein kinase [Anaerolineales bacterium]